MNAEIKTGMAILEEWLGEAYVKAYDSVTQYDEGNEIEFLNKFFNHELLLKDGSRDYIISEGKIYYLLNKNCSYIPKNVRDSLIGGNATEYSEYTRLRDVYGITKDLKVYYCSDGIEGVYGKLENYDIDANESASGVNGNSGLKDAILDALNEKYGTNIDGERGVTLGNAVVFNDSLELDGSKYKNLTSVSGLEDLKNLKSLTLTNLNDLENLKGLEGIPKLNYLYLKNTTVKDYKILSKCLNLKYLYIYLPSSVSEDVANTQILNLGDGLKEANNLEKLEYFGISGDTVMFDSDIVKNNDNPASYNNTNKLLWTKNTKSNVTSLGDENAGTGLCSFNDTIKNSIKYMFLNNNNFSNINQLKNFKNVKELQLQCNASLENINGIENHSNLEILTLHNCSLSELVDFSLEDKESKTKVSNLKELSIQNNSNLTSLKGIENSKKIIYIVANNCNITDIEGLNGHSAVSYLNLASNVNLVNVKYIQYCKSLKYVYLDGNLKMDNTEVSIAFNGTDSSYGEDVLIKQCVNGYNNIPEKYWELFESTASVLDYSYATINEYLTVNSNKWITLKGRKDVTKLKLDGQTQLPMDDETDDRVKKYGLKTVLSSLTGMVALSLKDCSQVNDISFAGKMSDLYEIDLRNVSNSLIDLSALNGCLKLNRLIANNESIDASLITDSINRFKTDHADATKSWYTKSSWDCSGYVAENKHFPDFSTASEIKNFAGGNMNFDKNVDGVIDLSKTNLTSYKYYSNPSITIKLPPTCTSVFLDKGTNFNLILGRYDNISFSCNWANQESLKTFTELDLVNCKLRLGNVREKLKLPREFLKEFGELEVSGVDTTDIDFSDFSGSGIIFSLKLENMNNVIALNNLGNLTNLEKLTITSSQINDVSWISSLTNLKYLDLYNNKITDISALSNLENIDMKVTSDSGIKEDDFRLSKNSISDLTPLAEAIGSDGEIGYTSLDVRNNSLDGYSVANNIEALLKLHKAGLKKVYITGNSFSENEVNDLINGKTIEGVTYSGFGKENVINDN